MTFNVGWVKVETLGSDVQREKTNLDKQRCVLPCLDIFQVLFPQYLFIDIQVSVSLVATESNISVCTVCSGYILSNLSNVVGHAINQYIPEICMCYNLLSFKN